MTTSIPYRPRFSRERFLRWASVLGLVSLGFIIWALVDPSPWAIMAAMSIGQLFGTVSFVAFLIVMIVDLRRRGRNTLPPPPPPPPPARVPSELRDG